MLASRRRHDTVILPAPPTGNRVCSSHENPQSMDHTSLARNANTGHARVLAPDHCCAAPEKLRHNSQLLGKGSALYGCRGMRPKAPPLGHKGRRVTNSHVIHYYFGDRHALTALDRKDL